MKQRLSILLLCAVLAVPILAFAGNLTMTTYYPAPTGNYDMLRANNIGVGTVNAGSNMVIADNVSIGEGCTGYGSIGLAGVKDCTNYNFTSSSGNTHLFINRPASRDIYFRIANSTQMTLNSNGNLGIGIAPGNAKLEIVGNARIGNSPLTPYNYALSIGDIATNYNPAGSSQQYSLVLNALDRTSIGFHDSGSTIGSIKYTNSLFSIGENDGWGTARTYFADNVGIGDSNPNTSRLSITTSAVAGSNDGIHLTDANRWIKILPGTTGAGSWNSITQANDNAIIYYSTVANQSALTIAPWSGATSGIRMNHNGNVGIAKAGPTSTLDVAGTAAFSGNTTIGGTATITGATTLNGGATITGATAINNGSLAINNAGTLSVSGTSALTGNTTITGNLTVNGGGGVISPNGFWYSSDKRLKTEIQPISNPLEKIKKLNGVTFQWKKDQKKSVGIIAQDVEEVFPELVYTDEQGMKSVAYPNLVGLLIEATKEQQKQIDALKKEVAELRQAIKK